MFKAKLIAKLLSKLKVINYGKSFLVLTFLCLNFSNFAANPAHAKTIKIALIAPLSGAYAGYGVQLLTGASQAIKTFNDTAADQFNLELIPHDDKNNPELAEKIAKQLAESSDITAIIGHATSSTTLAAIDSYAAKSKLLIIPSATNPKLTQRGVFTLFRLCSRDDRQGQVSAEFMVQQLDSQRIAILHDQDLYGKELTDYVIEGLMALDKTPVLYQGIPRGTKNFDPLLDKFKELEVDTVYFAALYPEIAALSNAMQQQQMQLPLLTGDGIALNAFVQAAGNQQAASSVIMSFGTNLAAIPTAQPVITKMQAENLETNGYTMYGYAAVEVIVQASKAAKSTAGHDLAYWLHQHMVNTVLGEISWDTNGDIMTDNYQLFIWDQQGKYQPIKVATNVATN